MKRFNIQHNIGKAKHVVNFHDGIKKHPDGSDFFDIQIFNNKKKMDKFVDELSGNGFVEGN